MGYDTCCRQCAVQDGFHDPSCAGNDGFHEAVYPYAMSGPSGSNPEDYVKAMARQERIDTGLMAMVLSRCHRVRIESRSVPDQLVAVARQVCVLAAEPLGPLPDPLRTGVASSVAISARQCARLLARGLFGIGDLSMVQWLVGPHPQPEKLKCLATYFEKVATRRHDRKIIIERKILNVVRPLLTEEQRAMPMKFVAFYMNGAIEDQEKAHTTLRADFANKRIGGGVLGRGCVQEEILFVTCPELIAASLICEPMADNEAIELRGFERFAYHRGYGWASHTNLNPFRCVGAYDDAHPDDSRVVAMDAVDWSKQGHPDDQYCRPHVERELVKCMAALSRSSIDNRTGEPRTFATGNWGTGAFKGNLELKGLIQWVAASAYGRHIAYFAFGDMRAASLAKFFCDQFTALTVGALLDALLQVEAHVPYRTRSVTDAVIAILQGEQQPSHVIPFPVAEDDLPVATPIDAEPSNDCVQAQARFV